MATVDISQDADGTGRVLVDGHDISSDVARGGVQVEIGENTVTTVTLTLMVWELRYRIKGARVQVDDETSQVLMDIGWTPPPA